MKRIAGWGAAALLAGGLPAAGAVPSPDRIADAVAETNVSAKRGQPLRLEVHVQIGERPSVASGILLTDPAGFARLELRGADGLVERHLMRAGQTRASRNGARLDAHRFFLPPLYVLQAKDGGALRALLEGLEVLVDSVGLAECGDDDCLVVGDAGREIPRRPAPPILGLDRYEAALALRADEEAAEAAGMTLEEWQEISAAQELGESEALPIGELASESDAEGETAAGEGAPGRTAEIGPVAPGVAEPSESDHLASEDPPPGVLPGLWVDRTSFSIRGMDASGGTRIRLGPGVTHGGVRVPAWIYIEEPGREAVRLHVVAAAPAAPAPDAFDPAWLSPAEGFEAPETPLPGDSAGADAAGGSEIFPAPE